VTLQARLISTGPFRLLATITLAGLAGLIVGVLPPFQAVVILAGIAVGVAILVEPISALVLLLCAAPLKTLMETEAPGLLPVDAGQLLLVLVAGIWVLRQAVRRRGFHVPMSRVQIPLLIFVAAVLPGLPGTLSLSHGVSELLKWIEMLVLISLTLALFKSQAAHWLVFALALAGGIQAVVGLYEFLGGSGADHLWILDERFFRAFGSFGQPNPFGAFMGLTFPLAAMSALGYGQQIWARLRHKPSARSEVNTANASLWMTFFLLMTLLLGAGLIASWSRGAWMGFGAGLLAMIFFLPRSIFQGGLLVLGLLLAGLLVWNSGKLPSAIVDRISGFGEELAVVDDARGAELTPENYAIVERAAHWQAAMAMAIDHPWVGVGFGNYEVAYSTYHLIDWPLALGHAHNYYLNLLAETGIVGLAGYLVAWLWIFWLTLRQRLRSQGLERLWAVALLGIWTYLFVHSLVDKLYVNNLFIHLGCTLGLLALLIRSNCGPAGESLEEAS
jgi:putative inorganic carbon (HCO3(-)) transporter